MTVDIIGEGRREAACRDFLLLKGSLSGIRRITLLPIPSSRNSREVTGTEVALTALAEESREGTLFAGYGLPATFCSAVEGRGGRVADVSEDEEFITENARLTAECTLSYIMSSVPYSVSEMNVAIVGYGRIGRHLTELLLFHGASVTVITRRESTRLDLIFSGAGAVLVPDAELSEFDLIVNTAPACLFSRSQCEEIDCEVLELAPGNNFPWTKNITRLPSLPAKMLPESSGRLYAEAIVRAVENGGM